LEKEKRLFTKHALSIINKTQMRGENEVLKKKKMNGVEGNIAYQ